MQTLTSAAQVDDNSDCFLDFSNQNAATIITVHDPHRAFLSWQPMSKRHEDNRYRCTFTVWRWRLSFQQERMSYRTMTPWWSESWHVGETQVPQRLEVMEVCCDDIAVNLFPNGDDGVSARCSILDHFWPATPLSSSSMSFCWSSANPSSSQEYNEA